MFEYCPEPTGSEFTLNYSIHRNKHDKLPNLEKWVDLPTFKISVMTDGTMKIKIRGKMVEKTSRTLNE